MKYSTNQGISNLWDDKMGSGKCSINSLRKSQPKSLNMVLIDTEMLDVPEEVSTPEQIKDVEMVDATAKGVVLEERTMEADLDPKIIESNSQATLVEELELFLVDPLDLMKNFRWEKS